MKWLQDNPLGVVLAGLAGVLALLGLAMSVIWTLPVAVDTTASNEAEPGQIEAVQVAHQVAAMNEFEVINEKPVFNETRLPVLPEVEDVDDIEDSSVAIKDAPDVRLTGVIITPSMKIASLTPADESLESVMAHEGQALTGEYVGWLVSSVAARSVVLESRDGQKLDLELQVHDMAIKEPPKPVAATEPETDQSGAPVDEDGEPLSRADQIRQRIAERREELRREQEEQQADADNGTAKPARNQSYQNAIRAMMKSNKDKNGDDNKDG